MLGKVSVDKISGELWQQLLGFVSLSGSVSPWISNFFSFDRWVGPHLVGIWGVVVCCLFVMFFLHYLRLLGGICQVLYRHEYAKQEQVCPEDC